VQARGLHDDKTVNINPIQYFGAGKGTRPFSAAFNAAGVPQLGRIADEQSIGVRITTDSTSAIANRCGSASPATINYTYARLWPLKAVRHLSATPRPTPFLGQFRRQDFGPTPSDERHHVTASATLNLPWKIAVSPIFQIGTGRPIDIQQASSNLWGYGSGNGLPHTRSCR